MRKYKDRGAERRRERQGLLDAYKRENPCSKCGKPFHHALMRLAKRPGIKHEKLSVNGSTKRLLEEIARRELLCGSCFDLRLYDARYEARMEKLDKSEV